MRKRITTLLLTILLVVLQMTALFAKNEVEYGPDTYLYWKNLSLSEAQKIISEELTLMGTKTKIFFPIGEPIYYNDYSRDGKLYQMLLYKNPDISAYKNKLVDAVKLNYLYKVQLEGKTLYIPAPNTVGLDEHDIKDKTLVLDYKTNGNLSNGKYIFSRSDLTLPNFIKDEIQVYKTNLNGDDDFENILLNLLESMNKLNLVYGGDAYKQGEFINGHTMCMGFTWVVSEFLAATNVKYRFVRESGNELNANSYSHIRLEAYNDENKTWYNLEPTSFSSEALKWYQEKYSNNWKEEFIKGVLKEKEVKATPENELTFTKNGSKEIYKEKFFITEEYQKGRKISDNGYKVIKIGYDKEKSLCKEQKTELEKFKQNKGN